MRILAGMSNLIIYIKDSTKTFMSIYVYLTVTVMNCLLLSIVEFILTHKILFHLLKVLVAAYSQKMGQLQCKLMV